MPIQKSKDPLTIMNFHASRLDDVETIAQIAFLDNPLAGSQRSFRQQSCDPGENLMRNGPE